jgi:predicted metal-dependent hydrolase
MDVSNSNNFQWIFIFVIVTVAWVAIYYKQSKYPLSYVKSTVDGEQYLVRNLPDKQDAADRLARTRDKLVRLRKYLEQSHKSTPFVANMLKNFDAAPARFSESTPDAQYTSYSVNKGEKIYMCLRQRDAAEQLVNENILTFVALHEMAHTGTQSIGHTPEFWNHFAWLIKQAERINIYEYTDFAAHPVEYCGVHITDSPSYKQGVKDDIKIGAKDDALL